MQLDTAKSSATGEDKKSPESRLTFLRQHHMKDYVRPNGYVQKILYNLYQCSCGNTTVVRKGLVGKHVFSCGCLRRETRIRMNAEGNRGPGGCRPKNGVRAPAHNRGKVYVKSNPPGDKYVTPERHDAIYYGLEGEVHSLRARSYAHNRGKKKVGKHYR